MKRYAQISGNIIQNVIESETDPDGINGEWIACGNASPGWIYDRESGEFSPAPSPPSPIYTKYIDIGPFFDRFKELKIMVLTHPDPTIKALITDIQIRKWIDLGLQEVQQALQYIGTVIPQLTSDRILEIINTPVADHENLALRKLYFNA